jgi:ubiquitin carboxyl-terminal hydrolase L5
MSSIAPPILSNGAETMSKLEQASSPPVMPAQTTSLAEISPQPESPGSKKRARPDSFVEEPSSKKSKEIATTVEGNKDMSTSADVRIDRENWQGFCEIESEPAYFSVILRAMGVKDVAVREVFGMDPDLLDLVPQPIYGLIFLFRYREFGNENQATNCPPSVWFCNQLPSQNSCGTLAMINILMNNPSVYIGEHLTQFKSFTSDMNSVQRGEAFASFDFIKKIHNSFAKQMDILENDKHLAAKAKRAANAKEATKKPANKTTTSRSRRHSADSVNSNDSTDSFEENGHHFIAFVPIGTQVWKLDGMDAQPTSVGSFDPDKGETWLSAASETINLLMAAGDDDYGVVAVTQSPLSMRRKEGALAINTIGAVEARLKQLSPTWQHFVVDESPPPSPTALGIPEELLSLTLVSEAMAAQIAAENMQDALVRRTMLVQELSRVAANIVAEMGVEACEEEKARTRRFDSGPVLKVWLEMLAENGYLEENLGRFMKAK